MGMAGFSGVMANFHPELYVWLTRNWDKEPQKAQILQDLLGMASIAEYQTYPVNAKYHLKITGLPIDIYSRSKNCENLGGGDLLTIQEMKGFCNDFMNEWLNS